MPEHPHRKPRMHNVLPTSRSYVFHLTKAASRAGVDIRTNTRARRILLENGTAIGIEAVTPQGVRRFLARKAVILAGGDYSGSAHFKALYGSDALARVPAVNQTNTGDCQQMVLDIGGEVLNGDLMLGPVLRFAAPASKKLFQRIPPWKALTSIMQLALHHLPATMIRPFIMQFMTTVTAPELGLVREGALLVGNDGAAIDIGDRSYGAAVAAQPDNTGFIVFDEAMARRYSQWPHFLTTAPGIAYAYFPDYRRSRPDLVAKADTITALGRKRGFAEGALEQAAEFQRRSFTSPADAPRPMLQPPFYALGPIHSFVVLTDGGVKVNERLQVLVQGDRPVQRLFAAGSTGQGGVLLEGHGHHLGWAFTSGRIAARNASALEQKR